MPRHHCHADFYDSDSSEEYAHIRRPRYVRHGSVASNHLHTHVHEPAYARSNLAVPVVDVGGRKRASSTNGLPQPNIIINTADVTDQSRSRSRERIRPRSHSRGRHFDDGQFEEIIERRGRLSRSPSPFYRAGRLDPIDYETRKKLERLEILDQEKAEKEAQERYKLDMELKKVKDAEAAAKKKEEANKVVEDWKLEQIAKQAKEREEKQKQDKLFEERFRERLAKKKLSPAEIESLLNEEKDNDDSKKTLNETRIDVHRPTYIKIHKRHVLPETLDAYGLPWYLDSVNCPCRTFSWQN